MLCHYNRASFLLHSISISSTFKTSYLLLLHLLYILSTIISKQSQSQYKHSDSASTYLLLFQYSVLQDTYHFQCKMGSEQSTNNYLPYQVTAAPKNYKYSKNSFKANEALLLLLWTAFSQDWFSNVMNIVNSHDFDKAETLLLTESDFKRRQLFKNTQKILNKSQHIVSFIDTFTKWIARFRKDPVQSEDKFIFFTNSDFTEIHNRCSAANRPQAQSELNNVSEKSASHNQKVISHLHPPLQKQNLIFNTPFSRTSAPFRPMQNPMANPPPHYYFKGRRDWMVHITSTACAAGDESLITAMSSPTSRSIWYYSH